MEINDIILDDLENLQRIIQRGIGGLTPEELKYRPHLRMPSQLNALFPNCPGRGHGDT